MAVIGQADIWTALLGRVAAVYESLGEPASRAIRPDQEPQFSVQGAVPYTVVFPASEVSTSPDSNTTPLRQSWTLRTEDDDRHTIRCVSVMDAIRADLASRPLNVPGHACYTISVDSRTTQSEDDPPRFASIVVVSFDAH